MRIRLRTSIFLMMLACISSSACYGWRPRPSPHPAAPQLPNPVRVTQSDGGLIVLRDPALAGDSIAGERKGERIAIALADVRSLEARRLDGTRVLLGIAAAFVVLGWVVQTFVPPPMP